MNVLAFDVGGTRVKLGVVEVREDGTAAGACTDILESGSADDALAAIAAWRPPPDQPFDMVGMCVPGLVEEGVVLSLPDKLEGLEGRDLRAWLAEAFAVPVGAVVNDALAAGAYGAYYAHSVWGRAGRVLTVTIGTGVGTAVLDPTESLAGGPLDHGVLTGSMALGGVSIEELCRAAALEQCSEDEGRERLAEALAAMAHAHTPQTVVLTGGPVRRDWPLLDGLEALVNERLYPGYEVAVRAFPDGTFAGLYGVALLSASM